MTHRIAVSILISLLLLAGPAQSEVKLVHAGQLLAVPGEAPLSDMTISSVSSS